MHHNSTQFYRDQAADPEASVCRTMQTRRHHCRSGLACVGNRAKVGQRHEHRKADERRSAANRHSVQRQKERLAKSALGVAKRLSRDARRFECVDATRCSVQMGWRACVG